MADGHIQIIPLFGSLLLLSGCASSPALHDACRRNDATQVVDELDHGADIDQVAKSCDAQFRITLRHHMDGHPEESDVCGTPLIVAVERGHLELARVLLERRADVNKNVPALGTALHAAAHSGSREVAALLVDRGAAVNAVILPLADSSEQVICAGHTPLAVALFSKHEEIALWLLEHGADPNIHPPRGDDPLSMACRRGSVPLVRSMIANGAKVNYTGVAASPLHAAVNARSDELVRLLLENGADPNIVQLEFKITPLHRAALSGQAGVVALLLARGADANAEDHEHLTPIMMAMNRSGEPDELTNMLVEAGAKAVRIDDAPSQSAASYWAVAAWNENRGQKGVAGPLFAQASKLYDEASASQVKLANDARRRQAWQGALAGMASAMGNYGMAARDGAIVGQMSLAEPRAIKQAHAQGVKAAGLQSLAERYAAAAKLCREGASRCGM